MKMSCKKCQQALPILAGFLSVACVFLALEAKTLASESDLCVFFDDFETGWLDSLPWISSGDGEWYVSSDTPYEGDYAARTPSMQSAGQAALELDMPCNEGELEFWLQIDSEETENQLSFFLDDKLQGSWSGEIAYTRASISIPQGTHNFKWVYSNYIEDRAVDAVADFACLDEVRFFSYISEGFESKGLEALPWYSYGNGEWLVSNATPHSGVFSAHTPDLSHSEMSSLEIDLPCNKGDISFWLEVSSEKKWDSLLFYIDDVLEGSWSGEIGYTQTSFPVSEGTHNFRWTYDKDSAQSGGLDMAWLDDIRIPACITMDNFIYVEPGGECNGKKPCYATIDRAIHSTAANGKTIKVCRATYIEDIVMEREGQLILRAGWDGDFETQTDRSVVNGALVIDQGSIVVENIVLTSVLSSGFESNFDSTDTGYDWEIHSGAWSIEEIGMIHTQGMLGDTSSISYPENFSDFDYRVRMLRQGCDTCANRIFLRGTPEPLDEFSRLWDRGYIFQYTNSGYISLYFLEDGAISALFPWAFSEAVAQGGAWNTLRAMADGPSIYFSINDVPVFVIGDQPTEGGRVGIGMYRNWDGPEDDFWVDWAVLSTGANSLPNTSRLGIPFVSGSGETVSENEKNGGVNQVVCEEKE